MNSLSIISSQVDRVIGSTPPTTPNKPDSSFSRGLLSTKKEPVSPNNSTDQSSALQPPQPPSSSPQSSSPPQSPPPPSSATSSHTSTAPTEEPANSQELSSPSPPPPPPPPQTLSSLLESPSLPTASFATTPLGDCEELGETKTLESKKTPDEPLDNRTPNISIGRADPFPDDADDPSSAVRVDSLSGEVATLLPNTLIVSQHVEPSHFTRMFSIIATPFRWLWSAVVYSGTWAASCFYDASNKFSLLAPLYHTSSLMIWTLRKVTTFDPTVPSKSSAAMLEPLLTEDEKYTGQFEGSTGSDPIPSQDGLSHRTNVKSKGATQNPHHQESAVPPGNPGEESNLRRSVRIRLFNQDANPKPRNLKSPTSPSTSLRFTRYPRNFGPPRPLLPKNTVRKTLILDLDETLIHSMSKGGRMSSGHMVEVKLDKQHAILYYVHKRPYCDEFLKKVCKWYNVVIFTASVQEYADPVIDWLDCENKLFTARYYRQHCTYRDGVYVKDLSLVEPDLSKVMIIDNSPVSYIFHKDNAIPIEGWISDPSDLDLLHLIPLLQGLQFVTDVRAFLALRMGEVFS